MINPLFNSTPESPLQAHSSLEIRATVRLIPRWTRLLLDIVQQLHYNVFMPVLHKFSASRVVMYAGDHLLAHVHVLLRDGRECTIELDSLTIVGRIAAREIREELQWIESNRVWLHGQWRRLNP